MNMFARFDENRAMILQDIKDTKRYGWTHARTDNVKTVNNKHDKYNIREFKKQENMIFQHEQLKFHAQ